MDFEESHSLCQMSVHSADKSQCVIAALVMLADKATMVQMGGQLQTGHHLSESCREVIISLSHELSSPVADQ